MIVLIFSIVFGVLTGIGLISIICGVLDSDAWIGTVVYALFSCLGFWIWNSHISINEEVTQLPIGHIERRLDDTIYLYSTDKAVSLKLSNELTVLTDEQINENVVIEQRVYEYRKDGKFTTNYNYRVVK